jgi:hypothetical protein
MVRATLATLAAVVLATTTLTGCTPTLGSVPAAGRCRVKFAVPYRPRITPGALIRGDATALCTGPVDSHRVVLDLERNTGAGWLSALRVVVRQAHLRNTARPWLLVRATPDPTRHR